VICVVPAGAACSRVEAPAEETARAATTSAASRPAPDEDDPDLSDLRKRALLLPVEGASRATLVPSFRQSRGTRVHEALDIIAPRGTRVLAVEAGTIAKLFTSRFGGLTVYQFDPSGRFAYYYAHLDGYAAGLAEGQTVARGQVLGYVGSTGNAAPDAPHLHFGVFRLGPERRWWQGEAIDPYSIFVSSEDTAAHRPTGRRHAPSLVQSNGAASHRVAVPDACRGCRAVLAAHA
jgi:murein DD-endopeptidase MepM/ murein hydrolase activator NlpD